MHDTSQSAADHELFTPPIRKILAKKLLTQIADLSQRVGVVQHADVFGHIGLGEVRTMV
jgi:hypothetical protein